MAYRYNANPASVSIFFTFALYKLNPCHATDKDLQAGVPN